MRRSTLGLVALVAFLLGPTLAWLRILPPIGGFVVMALGGLIALGVTLASLVQVMRGRGLTPGGAAALIVTAIFLFSASRGAGVPRINDFTTDMTDPPAFRHAATFPKNQGRDLAYPPAFAAQQKACCADLAPMKVAAPPADAFARAKRVAESMPSWTVTDTDPQAGTIEAVSESKLFHFQDDVVIRVRADGDGSRIDMRSKSRDGQGDFGVNAARIRAYSAALAQAK
jgi:uncharacterized protein (DUF1499 family)